MGEFATTAATAIVDGRCAKHEIAAKADAE